MAIGLKQNKCSKRLYRGNHERGFTLLEMTVVLTIMVLIAGTSITIATTVVERDRIAETRKSLQKIVDAIDAYHDKNKYFPCPAGYRATDHNSWGVGEGTNQDTDDCSARCNAPSITTVTSSRYAIGFVPVRTLSIDPRLILDSWGRYITYAVDSWLTCEDSGGSGDGTAPGYTDTDTGSITIQNAGGSNIETEAVVVLISHGRNGHGAFSPTAGTPFQVASPSALEEENAHVNNTYNSTYVQSPLASDFDDIVQYQTKWYFGNND